MPAEAQDIIEKKAAEGVQAVKVTMSRLAFKSLKNSANHIATKTDIIGASNLFLGLTVLVSENMLSGMWVEWDDGTASFIE